MVVFPFYRRLWWYLFGNEIVFHIFEKIKESSFGFLCPTDSIGLNPFMGVFMGPFVGPFMGLPSFSLRRHTIHT